MVHNLNGSQLNGSQPKSRSLHEAEKQTHMHREYIRALCDYGIVDCTITNGGKKPRYHIPDKGFLKLCMIKMERDDKKRN